MTRRHANAVRVGRHVVAYLRVSTDRQDLGLDAQRAAITAWARTHDMDVTAWFEDKVSGGAAIDERPGLLDALAAIKHGNAGALVVAKRDRLARDRTNAGLLDRQVRAMGAIIVTADGVGNDHDDPMAVAMAGITDVFAELERGMIRARTRGALRVKRARGERFNGTAPYGWSVSEDGKRLVVNDAEARAVRLVQQWKREGATVRCIGQRLHDLGFSPRGGTHWHPFTIARIARAPTTGAST